MEQEVKETLSRWSIKIGIVVGIFTTIGLLASAWDYMGFPKPASAMSVEKLEKGQVKIGQKVYENDVYKTIKEIRKLKREKRQWQRDEPNNDKIQEDIDEEILYLERKLSNDKQELKK